MNKRTTSIVLASALSLGGVALLVPGVATAADGDTSVSGSVGNRLTAIKDALKGLVTDGTLTQAQADKVATTLDSELPKGGPGGKHGGFGKFRGAGLDTAATALGVTVADLRTALQSGKSLSDVAAEKGVSKATLIDKLVAEAETKLAEAVKAGKLTQAQADAKKTDLKANVTKMVDRKGKPGHGPRGDGDGPPAAEPNGSASPGATTSSYSRA